MARLNSKKTARGPDHITTDIIWAIHKARPNMVTSAYNRCLFSGIFPTKWKEARLVLLRKSSNSEAVPSSYQLLCLLNDLSKILEFLLEYRLENHINDKGGFFPNQYGFRKILPTDDAARRLDHADWTTQLKVRLIQAAFF